MQRFHCRWHVGRFVVNSAQQRDWSCQRRHQPLREKAGDRLRQGQPVGGELPRAM